MLTQKTYLAQQEYYKDQRRAAQKYRLARAARGEGSRARLSVYAWALSWVGDRLVAWGSRLQQEYDTVVSSTVSQTAKPAVGQ